MHLKKSINATKYFDKSVYVLNHDPVDLAAFSKHITCNLHKSLLTSVSLRKVSHNTTNLTNASKLIINFPVFVKSLSMKRIFFLQNVSPDYPRPRYLESRVCFHAGNTVVTRVFTSVEPPSIQAMQKNVFTGDRYNAN